MEIRRFMQPPAPRRKQFHQASVTGPGKQPLRVTPSQAAGSSFIQRTPAGAAPPVFRPANATLVAPSVYRPNMGASLQQKPAMTAPPVYRPQLAAQRIVSPGSFHSASQQFEQPKTKTPLTYRPQMAVQRTLDASGQTSAPRSCNLPQPKIAAPPVYRPQASAQRSATPAPGTPVRSAVFLARPTAAAPPVYRPQMALPSRPGGVTYGPPPVAISGAKSTLQPRSANLSRTIQRGHDPHSKAFTPLDLQNASFSTVTALLWIDPNGDNSWECHGKFTSDRRGHAEEHLLTYLSNDVYYSGSAKVVIELTASPCGEDSVNCTKQLIDFKTNEAAERGIESVRVKALGFYKGNEDSMYNATEMISQGVDFEVWDVRNEMMEGTSEGYDNFKSMQNFAMAEVYQLPKSGRKTSAFDKSQFNQDKFEKYLG